MLLDQYLLVPSLLFNDCQLNLKPVNLLSITMSTGMTSTGKKIDKKLIKKLITRMHSTGMCTACSLP